MHITQHDVEALLAGLFQGFLAAGAGYHGESFLAEILRQGLADQQLVVHNEDGSARLWRTRSARAPRLSERVGHSGTSTTTRTCLYHVLFSPSATAPAVASFSSPVTAASGRKTR